MELLPHSLTAVLRSGYSEFDRGSDLSICPLLPVLYPPEKHTTQARKLFRRKPAITEFGKLFTPTHNSSQDVEQSTSSVLHPYFYELQPGHG